MKPLKFFTLLAGIALLLAACSKDDEFPDNVLFRNKADKTIYVNVYTSPDFSDNVLFRNGMSRPITVTISVNENGIEEELQTVHVEAYGNRSIRLNPGNYYCGSRFFQAKEGYRAVFSYYTHEETFEYERL